MLYRTVADLVVVIHLTFVLFVLFGGLLALKWRWLILLHLPAAVWGAAVEFFDWRCPLTPLESWLRVQAGEEAHDSDFISHYLLPVLYPAVFTRELQVILGTIVLVLNGAVYTLLWRNWTRARAKPGSP